MMKTEGLKIFIQNVYYKNNAHGHHFWADSKDIKDAKLLLYTFYSR